MRLCSKCALFGGHREHDIRAEDELLNELAMRGDCLREMLQIIEDNTQILNKKEELQSSYEKCLAQEKDIKMQVELKFQEFLDALINKKARVLKSLENIKVSVGEKFSLLKKLPQTFPEKVTKWKEEY